MLDSVILPLNFALTGPTRAVISTAYSLSPVSSIDSQPGTHSLRIDGSFSAAQVSACVAWISCSPVISMRVSPGRYVQYVRTCGAWRFVGQRVREIDQALQIMHRQEAVDVRQHRAHARRPGLELLVAQQRIQPDQLLAGLVQALHLLGQAFARLAVEAVGDQQQAGVLPEHAPAPSAS